jgi:hypothetical protein
MQNAIICTSMWIVAIAVLAATIGMLILSPI